jgi:acyl carrier protein
VCGKGYLLKAAAAREGEFSHHNSRGKLRRRRTKSTFVNDSQRNEAMSTATGLFTKNYVEERVQDRVVGIVREILERRSIVRSILIDEDLRDAGLTSLDMVNLMLAVEAEFDVKIPDADMTLRNFRSIAAIDALIGVLLPGKALAG